MKLKIALLTIVLLTWSEISFASLITEEHLKNLLEKSWQAYLLACASGKESELTKTLSTHQLRTIKNNLTSVRLSLTEEDIRDKVDSAPDLSNAKLVKVLENGPTTGLLYVRDVEQTGTDKKPRVIFIFRKFVKEVTGWKVDVDMTFETNKYESDGKETQFDISSLNSIFRIDGQMPKIPKEILMPDFAGTVEIDTYGYSTVVTINGYEQSPVVNMWGNSFILGGLRAGANSILISIKAVEKKPIFKPSVKVRKVINENKSEGAFTFSPQTNIEGVHTSEFLIK
jgi:hypothetical protein